MNKRVHQIPNSNLTAEVIDERSLSDKRSQRQRCRSQAAAGRANTFSKDVHPDEVQIEHKVVHQDRAGRIADLAGFLVNQAQRIVVVVGAAVVKVAAAEGVEHDGLAVVRPLPFHLPVVARTLSPRFGRLVLDLT